MIEMMPKRVEKDSKWYVVAMAWIEKWQRHTYFDFFDQPDNVSQISDEERKAPGPIDNSSILILPSPERI